VNIPLVIAVLLTGDLVWDRGCNRCHGSFTASPYRSRRIVHEWPGSLHFVHEQMHIACDVCHAPPEIANVFIGWSAEPIHSIGCSGCHDGPGLREAHRVANVSNCAGLCHNPGEDRFPAPEHALRPYYAFPFSDLRDPCGIAEDYSGDGRGLDNDGDGMADELDVNCVPFVSHFLRGDCRQDEHINLGDVITTFNLLFRGQSVSCFDACDSNSDEEVTISDAVFTLNYLYSAGDQPLAPFPDCSRVLVRSNRCNSTKCEGDG
jgi:hypothetical protein